MADWERRLAASAGRIEKAHRERDETIRAAYKAGMRQSAIGDAVGLSRVQVSRIINH
ncbi:hypothetical protein [Microbacterium suwonense]|uniref:Uncharacterized protein n=1 Tax=Microbacterium suwonense TaxID=683047 RepID=A0ABM8FXM6_9MICO|nr:hypothetical protein [Microbacterium suwonense]BDZ40488.1 hypothetical protein GCM10025863_31020 [Microbacterium suwonense]